MFGLPIEVVVGLDSWLLWLLDGDDRVARIIASRAETKR